MTWTTRTGTVLRDFQQEGVKRVHRVFDGRSIIADEVGLGKSVQSLVYADRYLFDESGPVVIVCPAHLRLNWRNEVLKHLGQHAEVLYGLTVPNGQLPPSDPNAYLVLSYNSLRGENWKSRAAPPENSWLHWLLQLKPRLVIVDEAHATSNVRSVQTRAVRRLARRVERILLLTGTPISNKPYQLWSLLNIVRPELYPSEMEFNGSYSFGRRYSFGWVWKGARNLDQLHDALTNSCLIRRRKCDVLDQLPPVQYSVIPIEVDLKEYHKAEMNFISWLHQESPLLAKSAAKAEELNKMGALKRLAGRLKIESVIDWVSDFLEESDGKLLLGALHYAVTDRLMEAFGKEAVIVDGRISAKEKDLRTKQFNTDRKTRLCLGNMEAMSSGWNCTVTSDVAACEIPWRPIDLQQLVGRCHGIERGVEGEPVHLRLFVAEGTIESDLCRIVQLKSGWADQAIDGITHSDSLPVFDLVRECIRKRIERIGA